MLHEGHVNERELDDKGDGDGADEHLVLGEAAAEAAVLEGGDEVEEDEAGEGLGRRRVSISDASRGHQSALFISFGGDKYLGCGLEKNWEGGVM